MKKKLTKKEQEKEKRDKKLIYQFCGFLCIFFFLMLLTNPLWSDEMVFKFKSPSFSGINASSHYLTIENQEFNRKMSI
ncbi:MAG TPA: hypothetical protein DCM40_38410, partial [Maribacter sp.]|nr:hypothetical protein [Maribacter sp.]